MKETGYIIQTYNSEGVANFIQIDFDKSSFQRVGNKSEATVFQSKMLTLGWMRKVKTLFPTQQFFVINL
jgi:hypothetical protein